MHYISVHMNSVKNITLSAEESLINKARKKAQSEDSSLNKRFREWLQRYIGSSDATVYEDIMGQLDYVQPGQSFSRDELNER